MPETRTSKAPKILHPMKAFGTVSAITAGIRVNRLEERKIPLVPFPHKHDFYHLLLITSGKGQHEIDFNVYPIEKRRIFLMRPGQVHSWNLAPNTKGLIVEFEAEILRSKDIRWNQLVSLLSQMPESILLSKDAFSSAHRIIDRALQEYEEKPSAYELILHSCLTQLVIYLSRLTGKTTLVGAGGRDLHDQFLQLVETHYKDEHQVDFYAKALKMTAKALTMRFYREELLPPRDSIQDRCLLEAKRLLAYSNLSIQEIGEELGFEDPNYFSRFFRKKTEESPGQFRSASRRLC
jgi:AraC family transcriptional activator of pobA